MKRFPAVLVSLFVFCTCLYLYTFHDVWRMDLARSQVVNDISIFTLTWKLCNDLWSTWARPFILFAGISCFFIYDSLHILFLPVRYSCSSKYRLKMCMTSLLESSTQKISIWWGQYILSIQWYDKYFNRVWRIPENRPMSYTLICKILFSRYY